MAFKTFTVENKSGNIWKPKLNERQELTILSDIVTAGRYKKVEIQLNDTGKKYDMFLTKDLQKFVKGVKKKGKNLICAITLESITQTESGNNRHNYKFEYED